MFSWGTVPYISNVSKRSVSKACQLQAKWSMSYDLIDVVFYYGSEVFCVVLSCSVVRSSAELY